MCLCCYLSLELTFHSRCKFHPWLIGSHNSPLCLTPERTRQKLLRILQIISLSTMNHEGCMRAIRNWVLNRSTVFFFFFFSSFLRHNMQEMTDSKLNLWTGFCWHCCIIIGMPCLWCLQRQPTFHWDTYEGVCSPMISEKLGHVFHTAAVFLLCSYAHTLNAVDDWS